MRFLITLQKLAQTMQDELAVSRLLSAIDVINAALAAWQTLTSKQVYDSLGLSSSAWAAGRVGSANAAMTRSLRRATTSAAAGARTTAGVAAGASEQGQDGSTDLLGLNELLGDLAVQQDGVQHAGHVRSLQATGIGSTQHVRARSSALPAPSGKEAWLGDSTGGNRHNNGAGAGAAAGIAVLSDMPGMAAAQPVRAVIRSPNPFEGIDSAVGVNSTGSNHITNPFDDLLTPPVATSTSLSTTPLPQSGNPLAAQSLSLSASKLTDVQASWQGPSAPSSPPGRGPLSGTGGSRANGVASAGGVSVSAEAWPPQQPTSAMQPLQFSSQGGLSPPQLQQQRRGWEPFNSNSEPSSPRSARGQQQVLSTAAAPYQEQRTAPEAAPTPRPSIAKMSAPATSTSSTSAAWPPVALHSRSMRASARERGLHGLAEQPVQPQLPMMTTPAIDAACIQILQQHGLCSACHAPALGLQDAVSHLQHLVAVLQAEHAAAMQAQALVSDFMQCHGCDSHALAVISLLSSSYRSLL